MKATSHVFWEVVLILLRTCEYSSSLLFIGSSCGFECLENCCNLVVVCCDSPTVPMLNFRSISDQELAIVLVKGLMFNHVQGREAMQVYMEKDLCKIGITVSSLILFCEGSLLFETNIKFDFDR